MAQLPAVLEFVRGKGLRLTIDRSRGQRVEQEDFPFEVLREAIANAIIHRDYRIEGATNYLYIGPDKIVVKSPGPPEAPLTMEILKKFRAPSISRNPKIMYVFNKMGFAEQRGIGLRNMMGMKETGLPSPIFDLFGGVLEITFTRSHDLLARHLGTEESNGRPDERTWVAFIKTRGEVSASEFAVEFDLNAKTAQRRLNELVEKVLIAKTGEKRGTRYHAV